MHSFKRNEYELLVVCMAIYCRLCSCWGRRASHALHPVPPAQSPHPLLVSILGVVLVSGRKAMAQITTMDVVALRRLRECCSLQPLSYLSPLWLRSRKMARSNRRQLPWRLSNVPHFSAKWTSCTRKNRWGEHSVWPLWSVSSGITVVMLFACLSTVFPIRACDSDWFLCQV